MKPTLIASALLALLTGQAIAAPTYQMRVHVQGLAVAPPAAPPVTEPTPQPAPTGILALSPASASFSAFPTQTQIRDFVLTNVGTAELTLSNLSLSGSYADKYSLSGCPAGTLLAAGASCTLRAQFASGAGAVQADQAATVSVAHTGENGPQAISFTGSSLYNAARPKNPGGASHPALDAYQASWGSTAAYGGFSVGSSFWSQGKYIVGFTGTTSALTALQFNVGDQAGGYYGVSLGSRTIVKGGAAMTGGAANGSGFSLPAMYAGDSIVMTLDFAARNVTWQVCSADRVCRNIHSATNLTDQALRVYLWKPNSGAVTVSVASGGATINPPAGFHNGLPD